jgi:hypothetical protein
LVCLLHTWALFSLSLLSTELNCAKANSRHRLTVWATEARLEPKVRSDLFIDFHFGQHRSSIEGIIDQFGSLFISDDEQKALGKFSDGTKKSEFLKKAAAPKLEHLWYLVVSICRILQSEDFTLNANEAYWLGLVDEIQGSDLPNLRELLEVRSAPRRSAPTNGRAAFNVAWLHHQHRSPHHWQHWVLRNDDGSTVALEMPTRYALEMLCDWIGAGKAIMGRKANTPAWYVKNKDQILLHPATRDWVEESISTLAFSQR